MATIVCDCRPMIIMNTRVGVEHIRTLWSRHVCVAHLSSFIRMSWINITVCTECCCRCSHCTDSITIIPCGMRSVRMRWAHPETLSSSSSSIINYFAHSKPSSICSTGEHRDIESTENHTMPDTLTRSRMAAPSKPRTFLGWRMLPLTLPPPGSRQSFR